MDVTFYRESVLEIVLSGGENVSKHVADLRLSLFIRAAHVAKRTPQCLKPFPPCFYDLMKAEQRYSDLIKHIGLIPKFNEFTVRCCMSLYVFIEIQQNCLT